MFQVVALYKFCRIPAERIEFLRNQILDFCTAREIRGLFLLSVEGYNGTMAGGPKEIAAFAAFVESLPEFGGIVCKYSESDFMPFERLKVDIRREIVTLKRPDIYPESEKNNHLSPEEWHRRITSDEDFLLIDTRNTYESEIGKFQGAVAPKLTHFSEFPDYVQEQAIPRDKTILMYCTGGIRCEKALLYMKQEGYHNVFQLEGGILAYLAQYPNGAFEGECYVFDRRVAVDKELKPTQQYHTCPHCGNPAKETVICAYCGTEGVVCHRCVQVPHFQTCSKDQMRNTGQGSAKGSMLGS
jgi:UPF0176 protein